MSLFFSNEWASCEVESVLRSWALRGLRTEWTVRNQKFSYSFFRKWDFSARQDNSNFLIHRLGNNFRNEFHLSKESHQKLKESNHLIGKLILESSWLHAAVWVLFGLLDKILLTFDQVTHCQCLYPYLHRSRSFPPWLRTFWRIYFGPYFSIFLFISFLISEKRR